MQVVAATSAICEVNGSRRGLTPDGFNPARKLERYLEARREHFLRPEELQRLGDAIRCAEAGVAYYPRAKVLKAGITPFAAAAPPLLMFKGCRVNEVLNLRGEE